MEIESKIVGLLKSVEYDPDWFICDAFSIPYFDNKNLKIIFIEAKDEEYLTKADQVLDNFLKLKPEDRIKNSGMVFKYYEETLKYGYTESLEIKSPDQIWNFVYPTEIIISWDEILVSCGCEWEEEHGLQLIFEDGLSLISAGGHE